MTNKEIARSFQLLGNIMELHGENKFKIRSYQNAYRTLRALDRPLAEMEPSEIAGIRGVGAAISAKIQELLETGKMKTLERYKADTPEGVQEMLNIKGFGPKKIEAIWKGLDIESIGELLYAVNENRLVELKGFGQKTQEDLKQKLEYYQRSKNKFHYAALEADAEELLKEIRKRMPDVSLSLCGAIRRRANIVERIEVLVGTGEDADVLLEGDLLILEEEKEGLIQAKSASGIPVAIYRCAADAFGARLFQLTGAPEFLESFEQAWPDAATKGKEEAEIFEQAGLPFIAPELREQEWALGLARKDNLPQLLEDTDIKGVIHAHTTYSDGGATLSDMAAYAKELGYEYIGITDHSKSAFYANGLQPERVFQQMEEIDALNNSLSPFRIFKGIESDILNDGSLDYEEDVLKAFDFIIASVHSNLRMDKEKATSRLVTAIENPYTSMLGHPTGRLLLSREAYPIDHRKVIDACAANSVAIELNANPYRLDLDWSWIPYALEKGILISINPDAHSKEGIHDIHYGVLSARKGGLTAERCLNARGRAGFEEWVRT